MKQNPPYPFMILLLSFMITLGTILVFEMQSSILGWIFGAVGGASAVGIYVVGELNGK